MRELLHMLRAGGGGTAAVRRGACEAVLGLTGSADGRALLCQCVGVAALARLIGDASAALGELAVKCLVNLSADAECRARVVRGASAGQVVGACMECLRDADCSYRHACLMLLCNVAATDEGCARIMQVPLAAEAGSDGGGGGGGGGGGAAAAPAPPAAASCQGLHLRRLIQLFLQPLPAAPRAAPAGAPAPPLDVFEYAGSVLASVSARADARALLLEPDRRILPVLFPQLAAASLVRRRGVAATLRNACFETAPEALAYMLAPSVDLATALLTPLAGPARYAPEELPGMHPSLARAPSSKCRESDATVRLSCVEGLRLLAATRAGRDHLRAAKAYFVVRAFHWWLEGVDDSSSSSSASEPGAAAAGSVQSYMVTASGEGGGGGGAEEPGMGPEDEATVDAINALMQQLLREDEVPPPGSSGSASGAGPAAPQGPRPSALGGSVVESGGSGGGGGSGRERVDETGVESAARRLDELALSEARSKAAAAEQASVNSAARKALKYATVPIEVARERARKIATGEVHAGEEGSLAGPEGGPA